MRTQQHIVEKVSVDVNVASMEIAEKVRLEISDFIKNEVLSIVESYFSEISSDLEDTIVQLDKVSLTFDTSSWNVHSKKMKIEIRDEVIKQFDPIVKEIKEKAVLRDKNVLLQQENLNDENAQIYGKDERLLKSLFHFLDHGTLPWWIASLEESRELFSESVLKKAVHENLEIVANQLKKRAGNQKFRERLLKQFSTSVVIDLVSIKLLSLQRGNFNSSDVKKAVSVIQKIEVLPKDVAKKTIELVWKLSEDKLDFVFQQNAAGLLFQHVHSNFFSKSTAKSELNSAFETTLTLVRFLSFTAGKNEDQTKQKKNFVTSVNQQVSADVWVQIQSTESCQTLISGMDEEFVKTVDSLSKPNSESSEKRLENELDEEKNQPSEKSQNKLELKEDLENKSEDFNLGTSDEAPQNPEKSEVTNETVEFSVNDVSDEGANDVSESESVDFRRNKKNDGNEDSKINLNNPENTDLSDQTNIDKKENQLQSKSDEKADFDRKNELKKSEDLSTSQKEKETNAERTELALENDLQSIEILKKTLEESTENSTEIRKKEIAPLPASMYVNNAGLILLNAFLPTLFKHLNLVTPDGKLIDPELSACILHYAATGREGDFEFEMAFEKYLCGLAPTETIEREIALTEVQKEEVNKVLNAVLEHWSAMKNKPIELLQNEFLSRPGKLITEKTNHRLVIEKKSFDLLLDKLPWSYSMVKFSWKKELIFVEW